MRARSRSRLPPNGAARTSRRLWPRVPEKLDASLARREPQSSRVSITSAGTARAEDMLKIAARRAQSSPQASGLFCSPLRRPCSVGLVDHFAICGLAKTQCETSARQCAQDKDPEDFFHVVTPWLGSVLPTAGQYEHIKSRALQSLQCSGYQNHIFEPSTLQRYHIAENAAGMRRCRAAWRCRAASVG